MGYGSNERGRASALVVFTEFHPLPRGLTLTWPRSTILHKRSSMHHPLIAPQLNL